MPNEQELTQASPEPAAAEPTPAEVAEPTPAAAAEQPEETADPEAEAPDIDEITAELVRELAEAKKAADDAVQDAQDQILRAQAELQNFRRRKEREASERIAQANASLIEKLLPVADDFELAFANVPESIAGEQAAWVEGFDLILRKLQTVLEREGVTPIDISGEFDPNFHEAVTMEPSEDTPSNHIIAELRRGYMLNDKVLRPSTVRVAM